MCGLVGGWELDASQKLPTSLNRALTLINHRGPDDSGTFSNRIGSAELHMGSARLAILDLSPAGHMPMKSIDGRFILSFNGEITNYVEIKAELKERGYAFRTSGDTEVLLAAWQEWGLGSVDHFEGMFAFAVYDLVSNELTLVRDPFGVKPLFFHHSRGKIYYGSEVQAVLELLGGKPEINQQTAFEYLHWGFYDSSVATFFAGIEQLRPGHFIRFDLNTGHVLTHARYWWPSVQTSSAQTFEQAADELRELFLSSVRNNLRTDVPLGIALSGGLDSSAITCAVRHLEPDLELNTFSFFVPGFEKSEQQWAELVNETVKAKPHHVIPEPLDLSRDIDEMIVAQGEPFGSTSIYAQYRVFAAAKAAGITVTLDGQGADEAFAGYDGYPLQRALSLIDEGKFTGARDFIREWGAWPGRDRSALRSSLLAANVPAWVKNTIRKTTARGELGGLYSSSGLAERGMNVLPPGISQEPPARKSRLKQKMREQLTVTGLPALLRHGDRNSMHFSIESRVPFLDRKMIEHVLTLPEHFIISSRGETKHLLRQALRGIVPAQVIERKDKIGFETPERDWLEPYLTSHRSALQEAAAFFPFLRGDGVIRHLNVDFDQPRLQWRLINLLRWSQLVGGQGA